MTIKLCVFDLDDTLVRTGDLSGLREACLGADPKALKAVSTQLETDPKRHLYSRALLDQIREDFPGITLGVFTRAPRSYAKLVLEWAYPGFKWDVIVAYENVTNTKPSGEGLLKAMAKTGVTDPEQVVMVGDTDVDIRAAYHAGCLVALDPSGWKERTFEHWNALGHVPDAILAAPEEVLSLLADHRPFLPYLEQRMAKLAPDLQQSRFDKLNHFLPKEYKDNTPFPIFLAGRSFSNYESVAPRRSWHLLSESIEAQKEADEFPDAWIGAVRAFIISEMRYGLKPVEIVVSVVPHRPNRKPRLEAMLAQLAVSLKKNPIARVTVKVKPDLLYYGDGVKSQHNDKLNRQERFDNVRDHLKVTKPNLVRNDVRYLIIDDVVTTGASLIFATKYLKAAGARVVYNLALAKNIGDL